MAKEFGSETFTNEMKKKKSIEKKQTIEERLAMVVNRDTGKEVISGAIQSIRKDESDHVINFTKATIRLAQELQAEITARQQHLEFQNRRLIAIESGEFYVRGGGVLIFNEDELNG